ncbi:(2Fe-2S)-binding protein [Brevibacillus sp. SYP-B805]|uniref:(2Fe-2S)-binding protein n=1 Tax=Brevibacillus sp. SYP-B805 TaxID=1578199 RepID=UPI0013ED539E|nr:(2Fe-2S)-binding protein [Brevibacillus sp. SYP-B805]NGQ97446.1 (2Fe-2S)-binding protein [Brevibacillus sp. SYP-B805]
MDQGNIVICRCEEVTLKELIAAAETYRCSARELKLRTRAGMGCCGGRTCRRFIDMVARQATGEAPSHGIPLGYQPPVRPVAFGQLGGVIG